MSRDAAGKFAAGNSGGPGRTLGSHGRQKRITGLSHAQGLAGSSAAILRAMNLGELEPEECAALLAALASLAKDTALEALECRVSALEARL